MKLLRWFACPCCDGEGGWTDIVDPELGGPYYPCDYCHEEGRVTLYGWLLWEYYKLRGTA